MLGISILGFRAFKGVHNGRTRSGGGSRAVLYREKELEGTFFVVRIRILFGLEAIQLREFEVGKVRSVAIAFVPIAERIVDIERMCEVST